MTDSPARPTSTKVPRPMTSSASGMRARRGVSSTAMTTPRIPA